MSWRCERKENIAMDHTIAQGAVSKEQHQIFYTFTSLFFVEVFEGYSRYTDAGTLLS